MSVRCVDIATNSTYEASTGIFAYYTFVGSLGYVARNNASNTNVGRVHDVSNIATNDILTGRFGFQMNTGYVAISNANIDNNVRYVRHSNIATEGRPIGYYSVVSSYGEAITNLVYSGSIILRACHLLRQKVQLVTNRILILLHLEVHIWSMRID